MALDFMPLLDATNKAVGIVPTQQYSAEELAAKYSTAPTEALGLWLRRVSSQAWAVSFHIL